MGNENGLKGKLLFGFGDSLVDGHWNGIGMLHYMAEKNGMIYHNYAINGATVLPCEPHKIDRMEKTVIDIAEQVRKAPDEPCDFICFDGLTNDAYDETLTKNGTISDCYEGDYDTSTFCGAFEMICYELRRKYQNSNILYICPHKMPTRSFQAQEALQKCARSICEKWSIPYVDMYRRGQINTYMDGMRRDFSYNTMDKMTDGNGTHLNEEGYRLWYAQVIETALLKVCR